MQGKKTGGRQKGTRNKRTEDVVGRLAFLDCDPIEGMALIAMDGENSPELRGKMFAELAQYVAPKLRSSENKTEVTHNYVARMPTPVKDGAEWQEQHAQPLKNPTLQ